MVPCVELNNSITKTFRLLGRKKKKKSVRFLPHCIPRATPTASPVSGARASPVTASGTV